MGRPERSGKTKSKTRLETLWFRQNKITTCTKTVFFSPYGCTAVTPVPRYRREYLFDICCLVNLLVCMYTIVWGWGSDPPRGFEFLFLGFRCFWGLCIERGSLDLVFFFSAGVESSGEKVKPSNRRVDGRSPPFPVRQNIFPVRSFRSDVIAVSPGKVGRQLA